MDNQEFWNNVRPRLAKGTRIGEIQRLYFRGILSYEDLINLPSLDAREIKERHYAELARQEEELGKQRENAYGESLQGASSLTGEASGWEVHFSAKGGIIAFIDNKGISYRWVDRGWDPLKYMRKIRTEDPVLFNSIFEQYPRLSGLLEVLKKEA